MNYETYFSKVKETSDYLKTKMDIKPKLLVVLTGGADVFLTLLTDQKILPFSEIPNFPATKAEGYAGNLVFGRLEGIPILAMQGRYHYCEGHSPQMVAFPYFVFADLGIKNLITTNVAGGINSSYKSGDIVVIRDHINMMGTNPLIGITTQKNTDQFTSMSNAYDESLRKLAFKVAEREKLELRDSVFIGVSGPSYETKSEIKVFRMMGADAVGMSSVFEVIACNYLKIKVLMLTCISNVAADLHEGHISHTEVMNVISQTQTKLCNYIASIIKELRPKLEN